MTAIRIIADDKIPFLRGALDAKARVSYLPGSKIAASAINDADALIVRTRTLCDATTLAKSPVKFVATATIGYDHIDTTYCESRGIRWTAAPGCNSSSVCQYVIAAILTVCERFKIDPRRKTLAVIGVGNVGSKVAKAAKALGMRVLLNDPPRARAEGDKPFTALDEAVSQADFLTFHVPLNKDGIDKTYHMIDHNLLERVKYGAFLLNTSRGPVADSAALKNALTKGKLMGAALDVWENEPDIDRKLMGLVNIATPHIAGYSLDGKARGTCMSVQAVSRFFNLGLDKWVPNDVPEPPTSTVAIDATNRAPLDILREAVKFSYDIEAEDARLRASPETFEEQRGNYPFRREFPAYTLEMKNCPSDLMETLMALGFRVRER